MKKVAIVPPLPKRNVSTKKAFTDEQVYDIRRKRLDGWTIKELCEEYNVTSPTIASAIYGTGTYEGV